MSPVDFPLARRQLDAAAAAGVELAFWWRDDDARGATPELARLLAQRRETGVPLGLAVIPDGARPDLLDGMTPDDDIRLFLHGWCHANHAPAGEKRAEFGDHRPAASMLEEIRRGRDRLAGLADERFLPVFVPPWNRIGPDMAARLGEAGLPGLSIFARPASWHRVHTHLDLMDWRAGQAQDAATLDRLLAAQIAARLTGE
ncbi:MAG: glycosyl transferase family 28, partial [Aurantimonas coralicida]|nr:glycosyl transferase family 28 [Aurantimonas coralicida]